MALDRFIKFEEGKPSIKEVRLALEKYIGAAGKVKNGKELEIDEYNDSEDWLFVLFDSEESFPFEEEDDRFTKRWFEVCCISDVNIDVITRLSDPFTNALAEGFAKLVARRWKGERLE